MTEKGRWYLLSAGELWTVYNNKSILNSSISSSGNSNLRDDYYWTSTEYDIGSTWIVQLANGGRWGNLKSGDENVRPALHLCAEGYIDYGTGICEARKQYAIGDVFKYNGAPIGYDDDTCMTWEREGSFLETKYAYVCHAELNAILNSPAPVKNCKIYVALFPCNECAKAIIQSGIKEIIYMEDKYADTDGVKASKKMLDACDVKYRKFNSDNKKIEIQL